MKSPGMEIYKLILRSEISFIVEKASGTTSVFGNSTITPDKFVQTYKGKILCQLSVEELEECKGFAEAMYEHGVRKREEHKDNLHNKYQKIHRRTHMKSWAIEYIEWQIKSDEGVIDLSV